MEGRSVSGRSQYQSSRLRNLMSLNESPHSQEGNLDTEAGPDIAEFYAGEQFVVMLNDE